MSVKDAPVSAYDICGEAVFYAEILSMTLAFAGYIFWYPEYGQQKKRLVYYYIIYVVCGYLLGIVCGFLTDVVANFKWYIFSISGIVFIAGVIYSFRAEEPPFDEYGDSPTLSAKDRAYLESDEFKVALEEGREWEEFQKRRRNPNGRCCLECKYFYFDDNMNGRCYILGKVSGGRKACEKFDPND